MVEAIGLKEFDFVGRGSEKKPPTATQKSSFFTPVSLHP
jgi:hypothetical protein